MSFLCQKCLLQHAMAWQWCKKIALLRKLIVSPNLFTCRRNIMGRSFKFWSRGGGPEECFANWLFILICCYPSFFFGPHDRYICIPAFCVREYSFPFWLVHDYLLSVLTSPGYLFSKSSCPHQRKNVQREITTCQLHCNQYYLVISRVITF